MHHGSKTKIIPLVLFLAGMLNGFADLPVTAPDAPQIRQTGQIVALRSDLVRFEFDLSSGSYRIFKGQDQSPVISGARLKINDWASDHPGMRRTWQQRSVTGPLGKGLALDLTLRSEESPELLFTFILHEGLDFLASTAGIVNTGKSAIRVKEVHVLADAVLYPGVDVSKDFAMIDGFSGGEPLEYGERFYNPLTRSNALKSRNNILLTFTQEGRRQVLVMGGLTYQDFEKFATIAQDRRTELELGGDGARSLLCYLDLPKDPSDQGIGGESLRLIQGKDVRTWENHQFRCSEMATSAMDAGKIMIEADNLQKDRPYTLGFSWWQGLRHGKHPDLNQSIYRRI